MWPDRRALFPDVFVVIAATVTLGGEPIVTFSDDVADIGTPDGISVLQLGIWNDVGDLDNAGPDQVTYLIDVEAGTPTAIRWIGPGSPVSTTGKSLDFPVEMPITLV